jgi:hypothetical protein
MTGERAAPAPDYERSRLLFWAVVTLIVLWAIYRPDRVRPFDILDFGEVIPVLKSASGLWQQVLKLLDYGASQHGRVNPIQVIAATLKWRAFGAWTPGWQFSQAVTMLAVSALTFSVLRRLGTNTLGAAAGATILILAPAATRGWIRLTMAEPLGMVIVLLLCLRALRYQRTDRWHREVAYFVVGLVLVLLTKELMAPILLLPVALALVVDEGNRFSLAVRSRRNLVLVATVGITILATLVPLLVVHQKASDDSFSSYFGNAGFSVSVTVARVLVVLFPIDLTAVTPSLPWALALLSYIGIIAAGLWRAFHGEQKQRAKQICLISLLFPVLGVLAYSPWPFYEERYGYPYLVGTGALFAIAVSSLSSASRGARRLAIAGWVVIMIHGLSSAGGHAARADAVQRTADGLIERIAAGNGVDSVFVATIVQARPEWVGLGPTLNRLALATDRPWPPTRDILCSEVESVHQTAARIEVVSFAMSCLPRSATADRVVARYRSVDWVAWRIRTDSVQAHIASVGPARPGFRQ